MLSGRHLKVPQEHELPDFCSHECYSGCHSPQSCLDNCGGGAFGKSSATMREDTINGSSCSHYNFSRSTDMLAGIRRSSGLPFRRVCSQCIFRNSYQALTGSVTYELLEPETMLASTQPPLASTNSLGFSEALTCSWLHNTRSC